MQSTLPLHAANMFRAPSTRIKPMFAEDMQCQRLIEQVQLPSMQLTPEASNQNCM